MLRSPQNRQAGVEALLRHVTASVGALCDSAVDRDLRNGPVEGIRTRRSLTFPHRKPGAKRDETRCVEPYHFHLQAGGVCPIRWERDRRDVRMYLTSRLRGTPVLGESFVPGPDFAAAPFLQRAFCPWGKRARSPVRLRFAERIAASVSERIVHPFETR